MQLEEADLGHAVEAGAMVVRGSQVVVMSTGVKVRWPGWRLKMVFGRKVGPGQMKGALDAWTTMKVPTTIG